MTRHPFYCTCPARRRKPGPGGWAIGCDRCHKLIRPEDRAPSTPTLRSVVTASMVTVFDALLDTAAGFTCDEADAIAVLLRTTVGDDMADRFIEEHTLGGDPDGDGCVRHGLGVTVVPLRGMETVTGPTKREVLG